MSSFFVFLRIFGFFHMFGGEREKDVGERRGKRGVDTEGGAERERE
jgi:hypothetical protein